MDSVEDKIRETQGLIGQQARIKQRPLFSSVHARTFANQVGYVYGFYFENDITLVALVLPGNVTWVDRRDLVRVQ